MADPMTKTYHVIKKTIAAGNIVLYWNGMGVWITDRNLAARYSEASQSLHKDVADLKRMIGKANVEIETVRPREIVSED